MGMQTASTRSPGETGRGAYGSAHAWWTGIRAMRGSHSPNSAPNRCCGGA